MSYVLIIKKQAEFLWGERKEHVSLISYYRSGQVNSTNMPVFHHSSSVWSIGTVSSNPGMLSPAPHIMSWTRNRSRWHRRPAVGHWRHHLSVAVSGRQAGEVFSCCTAFEDTTMVLCMCKRCQCFRMTSGVGFAKCNGWGTLNICPELCLNLSSPARLAINVFYILERTQWKKSATPYLRPAGD